MTVQLLNISVQLPCLNPSKKAGDLRQEPILLMEFKFKEYTLLMELQISIFSIPRILRSSRLFK